MAIPRHNANIKYTFKDYISWPDTERWEIIDGVPFNMSPAPTRKHQKISGELFASIHSYLKDKTCEVYSVPFDVRLNINGEVTDDDITNVVQPGVSVICDLRKLDDRGCKGSPDLIIEIVSPSTLKKDLKFGRPEVYSDEDKIRVSFLESLEINLSDIFID